MKNNTSNDQKKKPKIEKKALTLICMLCGILIIAIVCIVAAFVGADNNDDPIVSDDANAEVSSMSIETVHGTLRFPEVLSENIRHMEVTEGNAVMEVFYMVLPDGEKELFRIYYGAPTMGAEYGYLNTDAGEIPITYAVCEYSREDFADSETWILYASMMDGFSDVLNSISEDPRYSLTKEIPVVEKTDVKLTYWDFNLPENIRYQEIVEDNIYRIDFYGDVVGEEIKLYTVSLRDTEEEGTLGKYLVDGVTKYVFVEVYSLDIVDNWADEERTTAYIMMESINDVVQTIVSSENFSELI